MTTETPLLHDTQSVAAANYWNPASPLAGPGGSGQFLGVYLSASRVATVVVTVGAQIYGVLQNTPPSGVACDIGLLGLSKMVGGASIAAFVELMVDASGRFIPWVSGSGYFKVGLSVTNECTVVNGMFMGLIYNPNYKVVT
jgi:hypothetical protein